MMKEKKKGLLQRGIMVAVSALTIVTGAGTVLAYEPLQSSDVTLSEVVTDDVPEYLEYEFTDESIPEENKLVDSVDDENANLDFSVSDEIFIYYLDGTVAMLGT